MKTCNRIELYTHGAGNQKQHLFAKYNIDASMTYEKRMKKQYFIYLQCLPVLIRWF
ncbi:MAG: hypothetical protein R3A45_00230 [Bdellovibrionota bacterium]